jgi:5-(carboxyamino)imidazole ribonucleotide synthase
MGDALGVIGGGQLGSYFVLAARSMGFRVVVLEPDQLSPAGAVADHHIVAAYDDPDALTELADLCSAVTVEFENPPVAALEFLAERIIVRPSPNAVAIVQDRRREKQFCVDNRIQVAPFAVIENLDDVGAIADRADELFPAILKTARMGYDGKGQQRLANYTELRGAFTALGNVPCVLEKLVPLDDELSVIVARGVDGEVVTYEPTRNLHVDGVLDVSSAPIPNSQVTEHARKVALSLVEALDYVGVLGVEFFVSGGELLVNEMAPRPHNSGHWTLDAAQTSQFEQQVRALVGMPLGSTTMTHPAVVMLNLLGDRWAHGDPNFALAASDSAAHLHLYGKSEAKPGRKMGHLTVVGNEMSQVLAHVRQLRDAITPGPSVRG